MVANVAACVYTFYPINKNAAYLMMPLLAWLSFASLISVNVWANNRHKKFD